MAVFINESEWQQMLADRRRLIGLLRGYRNVANTLMRAAAFHHAATAPQVPFWEFVGLTEEQYRWWENDLLEGNEFPITKPRDH